MWGALEKKPHLVKWSIVCSNKKKGGLGVRRLSTLNKALLCKWICRFSFEKDSFWRDVINAKFGMIEGDWCTNEFRGRYGLASRKK